jgi:prephenate dehydrogenase
MEAISFGGQSPLERMVQETRGGLGYSTGVGSSGLLTRAVILGGLGQAGTLLSRSLRDCGIEVTLVDSRVRGVAGAEDVIYLQADAAACGSELRQAIAASDCLCVCLPETVALEAFPRLAAAMPSGSLWVDTLSVKTEIVQALEAQAGQLEALSINPMFAPALGWTGKPVAAVEVFGGPRSELLIKLLGEWGARVEIVSAADHDRLTAVIQVATHAAVISFGKALLRLQPNLATALRLATPPHRLLLTLLYRMATQNAQVYWDIQAHHPAGARVREQLAEALAEMNEDAASGRVQRFEAAFQELKALFEPYDDEFGDLWKRLFEQLSD